jgi:hypothetical protein
VAARLVSNLLLLTIGLLLVAAAPAFAPGTVQRIFALIELLRGAAAFITAPVLLHLAQTAGPTPAAGTQLALWICLGIAAAGGLLAAYLFVLGRVRLRTPDLERWQAGEGPALESPPLGAAIRGEGALGGPVETWVGAGR